MIAGGTSVPEIRGLSYFRVGEFFLGWRYPARKFENGVGDFTGKNSGFYSIAEVRDGKLTLTRDVLGGKPLYYSLEEGFVFSSFKRFLKNPIEVGRGERIVFSPDGGVIEKERRDFNEVYGKRDYLKGEDDIISRIENVLKSTNPGDSVVAFSGGLDSSILAHFYRLPLVSVTSSDKDEKILKRTAENLRLELHLRKFSVRDVEGILPDVIGAIETSHPVQVSIAIPIYLTMELARELGYDSAVLGQGADELFGGYKRYVDVLRSGGYEALENALMVDLIEIGEKNLVRDSKISYHLEMKMVLPYLSPEMIELSMQVPPQLKVNREGNIFIRKYILRKVAERHLSREIAFREKKAIQYSTGVMKILRKMAKSEGYALERYLEMIGNDIR